tara:strand:- start:326 stop:865 length:540 start_codon:yes stop_codon:yes gene_type:complete
MKNKLYNIIVDIFLFFFNYLYYMSSFINLDNYNGTPFELYENNNVVNDNANHMTGTFCKNNLSELYFSQSNIDILQDSIIEGVFKLSGGTKICKQSEDELLIVMRSIYLQYGKNQEHNLQGQIKDLNKRVLKYCIENINSNLKQYDGYIKDITKERDVLEMPQFVHTKGDKTLMPRHFI